MKELTDNLQDAYNSISELKTSSSAEISMLGNQNSEMNITVETLVAKVNSLMGDNEMKEKYFVDTTVDWKDKVVSITLYRLLSSSE